MDLHEELKKFSPDDFVRISWDDYIKTLTKLGDKIERYCAENNLKIDVVVPVMRGAMVAGQYVAYRFGVLKIVPVQYKYFFEPTEITMRQLLPFNPNGIKDDATILVVEQDHCFGTIGAQATADIKKLMPNVRILYAADYMDYSHQINESADAMFFGELSNGTKTLTNDECKTLNIFEKTNLYPWERMDEECAVISGKQFDYNDLDTVIKNSDKKQTF
ncbi:MAG: phosphoribosyltransferase [Alphaproteobacteria bacterium]|nr:phosphoribosyltransferase [Alphaproteobacteria bacterium]